MITGKGAKEKNETEIHAKENSCTVSSQNTNPALIFESTEVGHMYVLRQETIIGS